MKKILHYGNITGLPYWYARACETVGMKAENILPVKKDFMKLKRNLPYDGYLLDSKDGVMKRKWKKILFFGKVILKFYFVHYYSCSLFPKNLDYILFKLINKPMIISFAGTDVRLDSKLKKNPYFYQMEYSIGEDNIHQRLENISKHIKFCATTYELMEYVEGYFEKMYYLPQVIDTSLYVSNPPKVLNEKPIVLHIPTHREFKGTEFIESAVSKLKKEGLNFEFRLLDSKLTQEDVRIEIAKSDIIVDQIRCGTHGVFAIEAMASGKPKVCYIKDSILEHKGNEFPIINANPDTIYSKLKELLLDPKLRNYIGKKSREYAENVHSLEAVGVRLRKIYKEIGLNI